MTGNTFMAEARLRSDVYERGFAPLVTGEREFRGLPGEGVIVYQTHDDLQETLFVGGPLAAAIATPIQPKGFSVTAVAAIDGGMTVHVSNAPDPRVAVPDVTGLRPAFAGKRVGAAGLVANFTGASQTKPTYVASQPPSAGQLVAKGSTVAMRLVAGSPP